MTKSPLPEVVRACGYALTAAEYGLAGRIPMSEALETIAAELDRALSGLGCELRTTARLAARGADTFDN